LNQPGAAEAAKAALIERYVNEYNAALTRLAADDPHRVTLIRTADLDTSETMARLKDVFGVELSSLGPALNAGHTRDSGSGRYRL
jgi:hypothetical protein